MSSTIKVNNIQNLAGNNSGLDLSTNDQIILKTANTTALTIDSSQNATFASPLATTNLGTGAVLQVLSKIDDAEYNTTTSDFSARGTGFDLAITPSSTSNKILITITTRIAFQFANTFGAVGIYRSISGGASTNNLSGETSGNMIVGDVLSSPITVQFIDTPNTTSAVTYAPTFRFLSGGAGIVYIGANSQASCISLIEIKG